MIVMNDLYNGYYLRIRYGNRIKSCNSATRCKNHDTANSVAA